MARVVVAGNNHLSIPNLPRRSRHTLIRPKAFPLGRYPLEKIWLPLASVAAWQPVWEDYQLIHTFNCIPYTNKPWFITFEQHLSFYREENRFKTLLRETLKQRLALDNCIKIIAISDYARMRFLKQLEGWELLDKAVKKLEVIHPNFPVTATPKTYENGQIKLLFVGHHFARKGGIVALRLANKAQKMGLPVTVTLVSGIKCGAGVPTDFPDSRRYEEDLKLLNLPNVVLHNGIPNSEVMQLLSQSHFQLMATLHDTYGYSVVEGLSVATPAITTNVCALPELVHHGKNGYLLNLELSEKREWNGWLDESERKSDTYWNVLDSTYSNLADQALQLLVEFLDRSDKKGHYEQLSAGAIAHAQDVHDSQKLNEVFDNLYAAAAKIS